MPYALWNLTISLHEKMPATKEWHMALKIKYLKNIQKQNLIHIYTVRNIYSNYPKHVTGVLFSYSCVNLK